MDHSKDADAAAAAASAADAAGAQAKASEEHGPTKDKSAKTQLKSMRELWQYRVRNRCDLV